MGHKELSRWLKALLVLTAVIGLFLAFVLMPNVARTLLEEDRMHYAHLELPFEIFVWASVVPFLAMLFLAWQVFDQIGKDNSFCEENANKLKTISILGVVEVVYYFGGLVALMFIDIFYAPIIITIAIVIFFAFAISVIAAALSHLVLKAWIIKSENDLTV
ncbi:MAG: DUF2975 domain-containing protein [Eubacteriaceae bacterium]|nr:DUF2975 domain-containing protein [Eubacteriaceae bacterium]